ncbi:MAG: Lrp/AsnC family transcriptional regulator [Hyphomicrobiales bacterium]|nr:MAG: Lrp/AsnC family transcriptional regulator [Hyphomicrobiales bacterium]
MLDAMDRKLVNRLQAGFPLCERPFDEVGCEVGLTEEETLRRVGALLAGGQLSRFGPMYNIERMGGAFCLCALSAPEADFDRIAEAVNAFPEVAHNYQRAHKLNMWFVLAVETAENIAELTARIERATGCEVLAFPKLEEFFIGLRVEA